MNATETLAPAADLAPGLERVFDQIPREDSYTIGGIRGEVPTWVRGTYYLNGPARFRRGDVRYRHWLDGDGMVCALAFRDEGIEITHRFVRSAKWTAEEEAGRALFRTFGTAFAGDRLVRGIALEPPVNVSVVPFAGTLLAFGEQGLPYELDPATLETRGLFDFGGTLNPVSPLAAHAKVDRASGELWDFGVSFSSAHPSLNLYRFAADGTLAARFRQPLPFPCSMHDFCLAPRHAVFHVSPYLLDMPSLMAGRTLIDSLSWRPELGTRLLVLDRESGAVAATVPVPPRYSLHTINGFEQDGRLVVDLLELERPIYDQYLEIPDLFTSVHPGGPVRFVIDVARGEVVERREIAYRQAPDFAVVDPRRTGERADDLWLLGISKAGRPGRKFFDEIVHLSWDRPGEADAWRAPEGSYLGGEPVFVGQPGDPGAGVVICQILDTATRTCSFLLFDAFDVAAGPLAALPLAAPIHLGFHATFHPDPDDLAAP